MPLPDNAGRRHPAHLDRLEKGNRSIIIFLTVCTKDRQPLLANHECDRLLVEWWKKSDHWLTGKYVIMPDMFICFAHRDWTFLYPNG